MLCITRLKYSDTPSENCDWKSGVTPQLCGMIDEIRVTVVSVGRHVKSTAMSSNTEMKNR
jgi:hypothetical protein